MDGFAKILMLGGAVMVIAGGLIWLLGRAGFKGLPGDIRYQGEHASFYFPIVSCVVLSILATLALWIWQWLSKR